MCEKSEPSEHSFVGPIPVPDKVPMSGDDHAGIPSELLEPYIQATIGIYFQKYFHSDRTDEDRYKFFTRLDALDSFLTVTHGDTYGIHALIGFGNIYGELLTVYRDDPQEAFDILNEVVNETDKVEFS